MTETEATIALLQIYDQQSDLRSFKAEKAAENRLMKLVGLDSYRFRHLVNDCYDKGFLLTCATRDSDIGASSGIALVHKTTDVGLRFIFDEQTKTSRSVSRSVLDEIEAEESGGEDVSAPKLFGDEK